MTVEQAETRLTELLADAEQVQDACNLSGVVHSFSRVVSELWDISRVLNWSGTSAVNQHPICKLYASKIYDLARCN